MDRQTLSKKSRDELNGSLLTLYQKLRIKPDAFPEKEQEKPNSLVYSETDVDDSGQ